MRSRTLVPCLLALLTASTGPAAAQPARPNPAQVEFFEKHVRPVLADNCFKCHGPDKQRSGLRLDSRPAVLRGGDSGPVVDLQSPEASTLVKAIRYQDANLNMPPRGKLTDQQVAALVKWVEMGLPWPDAKAAAAPNPDKFRITAADRAFWAFQPVKELPPPAVKDAKWARSPIDRFLLAKLEQKGLRPAAPADRRTLIRRVTFDLTGLPPTPEEVEAFVTDQAPDAFARVVDRLLASPRYGERWARHWLDVARYGEDQAHTFQARKYPDAWRYRDWVVKAINADLPYDRFVMEQIAGDLLDGPNRADRQAALGLFALGPVYYAKAVADELDDRVDVLSRGFLGLTVSCARCHDHKFDPISTHDYYALTGVFASSDYKEFVLTPDGAIDEKAVQLPTDLQKAEKGKPITRRPVIHSLIEGKNIGNAKVNLRGDPKKLGDEVPRRFLQILAGDEPPPFVQGSGRLELAKAIASKDNPLTARVLVNRVWMHHFGRGIVATASNFGRLGEPPTHPELLDYLAARFVASGWSIKRLHREILLTSAYQMGSRSDADNVQVDPDNHYLWRMPRRKLDVEAWRDAMLAVAGNLDAKPGGPPVDLSAATNQRRTLYAAVSRHNLDPLLRLFDFPDPNLTGDRRATTVVPLQQLFVLNSDFMVRQSRAFAARLTADPQEDDARRIRRAYLLAFGRPATDREVQLGTAFLAADGAGAGKGPSSAWVRYAQVLLSANEFAFVD
jgi:mono/diheme cytochrome c family protein